MADKIKLTQEESELVTKLGDYKPEELEHWVNRNDNVNINCVAALQAMACKGYLGAVRSMLRLDKVGKNGSTLEGGTNRKWE